MLWPLSRGQRCAVRRLLAVLSVVPAVPKILEDETGKVQPASSASAPSNRDKHQSDRALSDVYRKHFLRLVHRLRSFFGNGPPEPEDVAQRAFEKLAGVSELASINNMEAFLWRIAKNVRISEIRSSIASEARNADFLALFFPDDSYQISPERVFLAEQDIESAVRVIEAMPEMRRRAYVMVRMRGLSHKEAAAELGVSRPAVSKHIARASLDLLNAMNDEP